VTPAAGLVVVDVLVELLVVVATVVLVVVVVVDSVVVVVLVDGGGAVVVVVVDVLVELLVVGATVVLVVVVAGLVVAVGDSPTSNPNTIVLCSPCASRTCASITKSPVVAGVPLMRRACARCHRHAPRSHDFHRTGRSSALAAHAAHPSA